MDMMERHDKMQENTAVRSFAYVGAKPEEAERLGRPSMTYFQDAVRRFKKNPAALAGVVLLGQYRTEK